MAIITYIICIISSCFIPSPVQPSTTQSPSDAEIIANKSAYHFNTQRDPNAPAPATMEPGKVYDYVATNGTNVSTMLLECRLNDNDANGYVTSKAHVALVSSTDKYKLESATPEFPIHSQTFTDALGKNRTFYYQLVIQELNISTPQINDKGINEQVNYAIAKLEEQHRKANINYTKFTEHEKNIIFNLRRNEVIAHESQHRQDLIKHNILCANIHGYLSELIQKGIDKISAEDKIKAKNILDSLLLNEYEATVIMESRAVATGIKQTSSDFSSLNFSNPPLLQINGEPEPREYAYLLLNHDGIPITKKEYTKASPSDKEQWFIYSSLARHNVPIQHPIGGVSITPNKQRTYNEAYEMYFSKNSLDVENGMNLSAQHLKEKAAQREQLISDLLAINHLYRFYKNNLPDATKKTTSSTDQVVYWEEEMTFTAWLNTLTNEIEKLHSQPNQQKETFARIDKLFQIKVSSESKSPAPDIYIKSHNQAQAWSHFYHTIATLFQNDMALYKDLRPYLLKLHTKPTLVSYYDFPSYHKPFVETFEWDVILHPTIQTKWEQAHPVRPWTYSISYQLNWKLTNCKKECIEIASSYCNKIQKILTDYINQNRKNHETWKQNTRHQSAPKLPKQGIDN